MKCSVFLLLPFKKNHAYAENVIVAYEEQPKVDFCKGIGIPLEIASSLTIMPLWHHGPRAFIIILFSAEGYNQPNYDIFFSVTTFLRSVGLCKINSEGKARKVVGETILRIAFQTVSSRRIRFCRF